MCRWLLAAVAGLALLAGGRSTARAAMKTWDGSSSTSWNTNSNWTPSGVPANGDDVTIPATANPCNVNTNTNNLGTLTISGGTVTVANGNTITVNSGTTREFKITSGSFTGGNSAITIGGSFTKTGGTFTAGTGTMSLVGSGVITSGGSNLGALTINASGTYTLSGTLNAGALTVSGGTLSAGSTDLSLASLSVSGGTLTVGANSTTITGAASLSSGTWTATSGTTSIGGSFTRSGGSFAGNGGIVSFTGTGTITSGGGSFANVTIASSGTYTLADALTTSGALTVTTGTLTCGANAVSVGGNFSQGGGTFNAPSGTMTVTGSFSHTSGTTFNANGGTLTLNSLGTATHTFGGATLNKVVIGQDTGLVGYWKLDEGSGSSISDSSGYGNSGTLSGGYSWRTPPTLNFTDTSAASFDGTAYSILGVTGIPVNDEPQTITFWVRLTANGGTQNMVTLINSAASSAVQVGIRNNQLTTWSFGGGVIVATSLPSTNTWHHVAYTFDGTTNRLYLDGAAGTSTTTAHQTGTPTRTFFGSYDGVNEFLTGALDDVRVYNRALSSSEVTTLYGGNNLASVAGGTHTFADAFVCSDDLVIGSGTVTGSSTLSVGASWRNVGGTFTGTGAVSLTATTDNQVVISRGSSFASLTISNSGAGYTLGDALVDTGSFTIASGATVDGSYAITVGGSWANSGTFLGSGTVTLNGAAGGTIKSNGSRFAALVVNSNGGTYTLQDRLWVPGGTVTLTRGTLAAGANNVHIGRFSVGSGSFTSTSASTLIIDDSANQTLPFTTYGGGLRLEDNTESNLVAYWKLDAGAGTQVYDFSGNGNNGTLSSTGATWQTSVASSFGYENPASIALDGSSGTVSMLAPSLPDNSAAQTISFWAKPNSTTGTQVMVALDAAGISQGIIIGTRNGVIGEWGWGDTASTITGATLSTTAWHHIVYTYDGAGHAGLTVDGVASTAVTTTNTAALVTAAYLGTYYGTNQLYNGSIDDVRVYNAVLTSTQIARLYDGRYAGTGGIATYTLPGALTLGGGLFADNVAALTIPSGTNTLPGGLIAQEMTPVTLTNGAVVSVASGATVLFDGGLTASSSSTIIKGSGAYSFKVGSVASARPVLNITGLSVQGTDANGMWITANTSATTTLTNFQNIAFSGSNATGAGSEFLQMYVPNAYLYLTGFSFGVGDTSVPGSAVLLTGNGISDGETRAIIPGATCATAKTINGLCDPSWKTDDDSDLNGLPTSPGTHGASVVQFIRAYENDTAGTIEGVPTPAFDWNTYAYYSTYAAFHDVSGTADRVYVRDANGGAKYSWDTATGETIMGTPKWSTEPPSSDHIVYVAVNGATADNGKIYRLIDNGSSLVKDTSANSGTWSTQNPFPCACTITTPLATDAVNLYWGATKVSGSTTQRIWKLASAIAVKVGTVTTAPSPTLSSLTITPTVTTSGPALTTIGATTYLIMGVVANVVKINATTMVAPLETNTNPGAGRGVYGRISLSGTTVYAGDDGGRMWALNVNSFTGTNKVWVYPSSGTANSDAIKSSPYYDYTGNVLMYGTDTGKIFALKSDGTLLNTTTYPYTPGASTDKIQTALFYRSGVMAAGTTTGKLFFIDRDTGSGPSLIREYYFGSTESVSGISFDAVTGRYMVTTSDSSASDGRLYYFDLIADPTPGAL